MTNADKINADLAKMEGECLHEWDDGKPFRGSQDFGNKSDRLFDCLNPKCYERARLPLGKAPGPMTAIPDRLSNGAYILGLLEKLIDVGKKLKIEKTYLHYVNGQHVTPYYTISCKDWLVGDGVFKIAVALAAIQRWKEGGG